MSDFSGTFDPMADAIAGAVAGDEIDLPTFLRELGVPASDLERAAADGTLELLALERIVDADPPTYTIEEVAGLSGYDTERIRGYWRALGFPEPRAGERVFSDHDLEVLSEVVWFIADGALEPGVALQMARVIGSSLERIARAQVDTIETRRAAAQEAEGAGTTGPGERAALAPGGVPAALPPAGATGAAGGPGAAFEGAGPPGRELPGDAGPGLTAAVEAVQRSSVPAADLGDDQLAIRRGAELLPMMPKVMEFVWRRHLGAAARQRRLRAATADGRRVVVGFADLVGFTAQTQQLTEEELADVVGRFEAIAYDVVAANRGRVVKMIGDEVMFVADSVHDGAAVALALAETYRNDEALSDVRVGMAAGSALEREGDVYGPVVNLASRIVSIAYPGAVVVDEDTYRALADDPAFELRSIRQHYLKDIGRVRLWTMRHADDETEGPYRNARDRRAARRQFLAARRAERLASTASMPADIGDEVVEILEDAGLLDSGVPGDQVAAHHEPATEEIEAITDVVLGSDIDEQLQVELLSDLEAARRLSALEREAQARADEADLEAEARMEAIEEEVRRTVAQIERDARRRVEQALEEAERKAEQVNEEASRKVKRVAEDAERKADQAEKEARRLAERKAARRKAEREKARKEREKAERDREKKAAKERAEREQAGPTDGAEGDEGDGAGGKERRRGRRR